MTDETDNSSINSEGQGDTPLRKEEAGPPPPPLPPKKRRLFGGKGITMPASKPPKKKKAPREPKVREAKPPRKPFFKKKEKKAGLEPPRPAAAGEGPETKEAPAAGVPESGGADKPLFGKRQPKAPREPGDGKQKQPAEKKPKKPLFNFKKREKKEPEATAAFAPAEAREAKKAKPKKPLFGKKKKDVADTAGIGGEAAAAKEPKEPKKRKGGGAAIGSKTSPVGLDLGRSSITAVRLRHQTSGSVLQQAALDALPEGLIQEGEVRDVEALSSAIRDFWKRYKIRGRKVALGLANQKIVVRTLDFPMLEPKELRSAIEFQAQDYIPIPIDQAVFDYHVLGSFTDHDGVEKQKVLVVAAQKDMVMDFINAVKKARLQVAGVDLQAFALIRSQITRSFLDEGAPQGTAIAVANIASDVTNLVVDVSGEPQFTRIISFGGDDFTKSVQDQMGITFTEAEVLKMKFGLAPASEAGDERESLAEPNISPEAEAQTGIIPPPPEGGEREEPAAGAGTPFGASGLEAGAAGPAPEKIPVPGGETAGPGQKTPDALWPPTAATTGDSETAETVQRALEITTEALADELRRSLDYYMSQENSIPIGKLLISGGGAMLPNLDLNLSQMFPFDVEIGNPLMRVAQNKSGLGDDELAVLAPRLAIAIGLALEDED